MGAIVYMLMVMLTEKTISTATIRNATPPQKYNDVNNHTIIPTTTLPTVVQRTMLTITPLSPLQHYQKNYNDVNNRTIIPTITPPTELKRCYNHTIILHHQYKLELEKTKQKH